MCEQTQSNWKKVHNEAFCGRMELSLRLEKEKHEKKKGWKAQKTETAKKKSNHHAN